MPAATERDRDLLRLELIIKIGGRIRTRLEGVSRERFLSDQDELDLASFRLAAIGEYAGKLSAGLRARHPEVGWNPAYSLRNAVVHDYDGIIAERIWDALGGPLDVMLEVCRAELGDD